MYTAMVYLCLFTYFLCAIPDNIVISKCLRLTSLRLQGTVGNGVVISSSLMYGNVMKLILFIALGLLWWCRLNLLPNLKMPKVSYE